jgi:hypothetical protein
MPHPRVRAFISIFEASSSLAAHVDTDAGEYVIKVANNPEGPRVLVNEWVATSLARAVGVVTPDFAIVEVPEALSFELRPGLAAVPGPAFGSRFERGQPWKGTAALATIANPEMLSRMVMLDTWLLNVDRHSVSPDGTRTRINKDNVFLSQDGAPAGQFRLKAIDQGHCFGGPTWTTRTLRAIDTVRDRRVFGRFPEFDAHLDLAEVRRTLEAALRVERPAIDAIVAGLPASSWGLTETDAAALREFLDQRIRFLDARLLGMLWPQLELGGGNW